MYNVLTSKNFTHKKNQIQIISLNKSMKKNILHNYVHPFYSTYNINMVNLFDEFILLSYNL